MSILLTLIFHFFYVKIPYIFYGGIKTKSRFCDPEEMLSFWPRRSPNFMSRPKARPDAFFVVDFQVDILVDISVLHPKYRLNIDDRQDQNLPRSDQNLPRILFTVHGWIGPSSPSHILRSSSFPLLPSYFTSIFHNCSLRASSPSIPCCHRASIIIFIITSVFFCCCVAIVASIVVPIIITIVASVVVAIVASFVVAIVASVVVAIVASVVVAIIVAVIASVFSSQSFSSWLIMTNLMFRESSMIRTFTSQRISGLVCYKMMEIL